MNDRIQAPFTEDQVKRLNEYQRDGRSHPYTCGGNRSDEAHRRYAKEHGALDYGILVATVDGGVCPVCNYRQSWGHTSPIHAGKPTIPDLLKEMLAAEVNELVAALRWAMMCIPELEYYGYQIVCEHCHAMTPDVRGLPFQHNKECPWLKANTLLSGRQKEAT